MRVYLAGPDVFKHKAIQIGENIKYLCSCYGIEGVFPLDNEVPVQRLNQATGKEIARLNVELIESCDAVLANLESFRGPSADCGTVWECAYAKGLGKFVAGYNYSTKTYKEKVMGKVPHDGMAVEDFDVFDNIMLVHGLDYYDLDIDSCLRKISSLK